MKLLQVSPRTEIAGGERVLLQLCHALQEAGHEVACVCPGEGDLAREIRSRGMTCHLLPVSKTYDLGVARALARILQEGTFDLLHTHGMLVNILGRWAARGLPEVASVSTVHLTRNLWGPVRVGGWRQALKNRLYYAPVDNWTSRWNDRVIAVSRAVRDDLVAQGYRAEQITVIPNGIELEGYRAPEGGRKRIRAELGIPPEAFLVGSLARLSPQKDLPTLVEAFLELRREHPEAWLLVAGTGPLEGEIRDLVRSRGIEDRFLMLGFRSDVPALLAACDVFALSSRWEGLPLSVLEAMAAGRPVVATKVPGTMEAMVHGQTGLLVEIGDGPGLGRSLARLAADPEARRSLGEGARRRAESEFSVARTTGSHLELYQQLCESRRG